jgi:hypothetical protein
VDNSVDQILHEYRARQHWERREYRAALDYAAAAAGKALTKADVVGYWRMTLLLAECQMELGLMQDFAQSMKELSEHPAVKDDPKMLGRAKALHSRSMGMLGHVGEALVLAKEAAELGDPLNEDGIGAMEMLHSLVAALAESGNLPVNKMTSKPPVRLIGRWVMLPSWPMTLKRVCTITT